MFLDMDRVIAESNKKMLYGEKPKVPSRLERITVEEVEDYGNYKTVGIEREPNNTEIREKINQIIEYLEWIDK